VSPSQQTDASGNLYAKTPIKTFVSPADPSASNSQVQGSFIAGWGATSYGVNAQVFGAPSNPNGTFILTNSPTYLARPMFDRGMRIVKIADGSSNTVLATEKYATCGNGGSAWGIGSVSGFVVQEQSTGTVWAQVPNSVLAPYLPFIAFGVVGDPTMNQEYSMIPQQAAGSPLAVNGPTQSTNNAVAGTSRALPMRTPAPFSNQYNYATNTGCDYGRPSSPHAGGILTLMGDASVRTTNFSVQPTTWWMALCPNDGQPMPGDW
jgi:hypothetical protein